MNTGKKIHNRRQPFFYQERKKRWPRFLLLLVILIVLLIWGARVPALRQLLARFIIDPASYGVSLVRPIYTPDPLNYRIETMYPTIELPSKEVIFAENLLDIESPAEETVFEFTPTPTQGVLWMIATPQNQEETKYDLPAEAATNQLVLPSFEMQDYANDAAVVLSSALRYHGKTENQYSIAAVVRPDYFDPNVSFLELQAYVHETYPEFDVTHRLNGDTESLIQAIYHTNSPVIIRMEIENDLPQWKGDDRWGARFVLISGYDIQNESFIYLDPLKGSDQTISFEDLMARWYPFTREYLMIAATENAGLSEQKIGDAALLAELEENRRKFAEDVAMVPENRFAWLNYGRLLTLSGDYESAWNAFRSAVQIGLPQRYLFYDSSFYKAAFHNGIAQEIFDRTDLMLQMNGHSEENWLWQGWALLLMNQREQAKKAFQKALEINPGMEDGRYALEYLRQY